MGRNPLKLSFTWSTPLRLTVTRDSLVDIDTSETPVPDWLMISNSTHRSVWMNDDVKNPKINTTTTIIMFLMIFIVLSYTVLIFPPSFSIFPTISSYPRSIYSTLVMVVSPLAIIPARIIVTQALRSHDDTIAPRRGVAPNISASCGFSIAICPFIFSISMSQLSLPSKRTSWTRETHSAWVRRREKGDWRSVGNPGNIFVWILIGLSESRLL